MTRVLETPRSISNCPPNARFGDGVRPGPRTDETQRAVSGLASEPTDTGTGIRGCHHTTAASCGVAALLGCDGMTVVARIALTPSSFALGRAFETIPGLPVTARCVVPVSQAAMPYFWVETTDGNGVAKRLREADRVGDVTVLDETESQSLLKVSWAEAPDDVLSVMSDTDATALDVAREMDTWVFRLQFPGYDSLSMFNHQCRERGIEVSLERVHRSAVAGEPRDGLTPEQRELLATALEVGYFEVPRQTTLRELGDDLGISDSAASQRLRRGLSTLLADNLRAGKNEPTE